MNSNLLLVSNILTLAVHLTGPCLTWASSEEDAPSVTRLAQVFRRPCQPGSSLFGQPCLPHLLKPSPLDFTFVTGCGTLHRPGTYLFAANVTTSGSGACLTIAASDVVIDLRGHGLIRTSPSGGSIAIAGIPGIQKITLRNGFVRGFGIAVSLIAANEVAISGILFSEIDGHAVLLGKNGSVEDSAFDQIGDGRAIEAAEDFEARRNLLFGASIACRRRCEVTENSFSYSNGAVIAGPASRIEGNALFNVSGNGIVLTFDGTVSGSPGFVARNTLLGRSSGSGILANTLPVQIRENQVSQFAAGIRAPSGSTVAGNLVTGQSGVGIVAGANSLITRCAVVDNAAAGILFTGGGGLAASNFVAKNGGVPPTNTAVECGPNASEAASNTFTGNFKDETSCLDGGENLRF